MSMMQYSMFGRVDKTNPVADIPQELSACCHRFRNARIVQPVATAMRLQVGVLSKNAPHCAHGAQWRMMPNDLPPWHTVCQQTQRWWKAGVFETLVRDYERLTDTLVGLRYIAFAVPLTQRFVPTLSESS